MMTKYIVFIMILVLPLLYFFTNVQVIEAGCDNPKPGEPLLVSAVAADKSITLNWIEPAGDITYYLLRYGLDKDNLMWGISDIGGKGTTSFTIHELENNVKYFFQIRAGNGCEPGSFSNTVSVKSGLNTEVIKTPNLSMVKQVLGTASNEAKIGGAKKPEKVAALAKDDNCAFTCNSLPILISEIVALLVYFLLAHIFHKVPPIFSVIIPIASIWYYYHLHGMCNPYNFYCRYFLPLTITIYLLILIPQKFSLLSRHNKVKKVS